MAAGRDLVLGYDFGTSAVKAALFNAEGTVVASADAPYPLYLPQRGWAEQSPDEWWTAMQAVTANLLRAVPDAASRIAAIGLCAQMGGVVPVDRNGAALANGLIWLDTRSAAIARELMGGRITVSGYGPLRLARWLWLTGGAPNLSGKDAISKIVWLRRNRTELWPRIYKLLDVKDYLLHRCTGRFATTFDSAHLTWLFDARKGKKRWSPGLMRQIDLDPALLPEIIAATDIAGELLPEAAEALGLRPGTPVTGGAGDVSATAMAAGNPGQGSLHLHVGTSAWLACRLERSRVDPATSVGSLCFADGKDYLLIATQENAGASIRWGRDMLGFPAGDFAAFEAAAARARPSRTAPMFFPWLTGERVPVDDERVRGSFANLSIESGRDEIAFAMYEGIALNMRWAMTPFDRLSGRAGQRLRLLGGGGRSRFWAQMFADVLGREVEQVEAPELCGALGGAMTAAVAAGWYPDLATATTMVRATDIFSPAPQAAEIYDRRFEAFSTYYSRLRRWYRGHLDPTDAGKSDP